MRIVDLDATPDVAARFAALLAPDEAARAARFHFDELRRNYAVGRGALRILLGRRLRRAPAAVELRAGERGKPFAGEAIDFNVSHSGSLLVLAFTRGCALGVDVEIGRPLPDLLQLAERFFHRDETAELLALPPGERAEAFFRCWTRKEAYVKATADGLHVPLDAFRVTLRREDAPRFVHIGGDAGVAAQWRLHHIPVGCAGALAYRDAIRPLRIEQPMRATDVLDLLEE